MPLELCCKSTEVLQIFGIFTDIGTDITLLSVRSTQLHTRSID